MYVLYNRLEHAWLFRDKAGKLWLTKWSYRALRFDTRAAAWAAVGTLCRGLDMEVRRVPPKDRPARPKEPTLFDL